MSAGAGRTETGFTDMRFFRTAVLTILVCLAALQAQDPWQRAALIHPEQLAAEMKGNGHVPAVIFVGFPVLYRAVHIKSAVMAGPASSAEGLTTLEKAAAGIPKDRDLVIYCGCCPFAKCPNVRPAYKALREMGFTHVRVLELDTNLHTDWVERGYPVSRGR